MRVQLSTPALATGRRGARDFTVAGAKVVRDAFEVRVPAGGGEVHVQVAWSEGPPSAEPEAA